MAAVLDSLASYVADMVIEMAKEEVAMLIGVSGEIENLGIKLRDLKNFLADADRRNITDDSVQGWVEELKRAMYDVTDILDLCQLKVMEQGPSKDMGCLNPLLFCMRNPLHAHDIGSRIKTLNQKLDDIFKRGSSFNFIKLEAYQDRMVTRSQAVDRKTDPLLERSGVVGEKIEDDTRALVKVLTEEVADDSDSIMIVAIAGVGGIGKTTFSKKVFNDEAIQGKFAKKIWLSITQVFNEVELLRTAITAANGNLPGSGGGSRDKAFLVPALADAVRDKKIFLVLDDMWGTNEWNNLLMAPFSHAAPNSRILVTTRHETVARGMKAKHPYHHVGKLGPEDAWTLLKKQVLATEKSEPAIDMLKDIGLEIIEKCDGLPLAIKVMGGLLCQKDKQRCDWEKVLNDAIWSISRMPEELNYAIYISYGDLSPSLKQCFLHYSLKPKKTIIHDVQLVGMWIGEGFVHGDSDRLEELGIEYHKELILRILIEPDTSYAGQYICNMHDVVRSFAQYVTRDEALVAHRGGTVNSKLSLQRFLRLSIETRGVESDEFEWRSLHEQKSLRSLILVGKFKIQSGDSLIPFSSLRTLHIEYANFAALFKSLYQLKHLRYLALRECNDIKSLRENIHKMKFLQHISVAGCQNLVKLPDTIVKLQGLRYLELYGTSVSSMPIPQKKSMPRGFSALTNLRILWGFHTHMDGDWCSLEELQPLSQLGEIGLASLENVSAASFATKARLSEKVYLSCMALYCKSRLGDDGLVKEEVSEQDQGTIMEVFDELYPPPYVQDIRIQGYFGRQLPKWMMSTATTPLNSLRILIFEDLACCIQLPNGLCQLPYLDYLEVNRAPAIKRVGPEFLQPYSHHHHASFQALAAFPRLNKMIFRKMVEWEEWDWEEDMQAMPVLEELIIHDCKRRIPLGLVSHARALKKLTIWSIKCLHSLENFASVVELDLYDLPELTSISNLPKLQKLAINCCPKLESLQEMTVLRRLVLTVFYNEKRLPLFMQTVKPSHLLLDCSPEVLASMAVGKSGVEWDMFSHIQHVEAYANDEGTEKRWHLFYTREPYKMETNVEANQQFRLAGLI
ncbi:hypothetical protein CFC21_064107 [Triticum aestivum]|uniref:Uncharacterized protein n=2 Tax=Triticum aestivum TaxID=4565 RepID=A0A3B6KB47_WHEAT|nr:hypothetical protein CFC21_064107 [Triticum aestivum]